jgi:cyanate permease
MINKGLPKNVAVYYNRKIIHITSGGLIAFLTPIIFAEPFTPFIFSIILAFITLYPHLTGNLLEWFQTKDNLYEVNFCIAWGSSVLILWIMFNNPWISILPALFISLGDAATGIVRNTLFRKRTKHWIGNIAMAAATALIGYIFAGISGVIAGVAASIIERFEYKIIDDNILIVLISTLTLLILWPATHLL